MQKAAFAKSLCSLFLLTACEADLPGGLDDGSDDPGNTTNTDSESSTTSEYETDTDSEVPPQGAHGRIMPEHTGNYLIVANPEVIPWLNELIEYRSLDYTVRVADTAEIGNTKEAIKAYIQEQYDNVGTRPEYLLLAMYRGENRSMAIPWYNGATYYTWESGNTEIPSYSWYSYLAGDDLISDVYLGLFSVLSQTEVDNAVRKIKETEESGYSNPKNVGFFMSLGWELVEEWAPMVSEAGYSSFAYHVLDEATQQETTAEFVKLLEHELRLFYLNGHGAPPGLVGIWATWALESGVENTVYPLAFTGACNTGNWYLDKTVKNDVFTEAMVFRGSTMAAAMLANSHYGGHYDKPMYHEIFRSHLLDGVSQVGKLAHLGKIKCLDMNNTDGTPFYAFNQEMVHLWGDPATELNGRAATRPQKLVHVVFGTGDGYYTPGATTTIQADVPANSQFAFSHWQGDTEVLADSKAQATTVTVPSYDVVLEAVYEVAAVHAIPGVIEGENANERQGGIPVGQSTPAASLLLPGNTHTYEVNVETSGEYRCDIRYATQYLSGVVSVRALEADASVCSATLPVQGGDIWSVWGQYFEQTLDGTLKLQRGPNTIQLQLDSGTIAYDWLKFTLVQPLSEWKGASTSRRTLNSSRRGNIQGAERRTQ
ncbi:MAG: C25 family cysteine peptidase [Myxococcota bacterium]|jgi:hypothetical protein|nr:C25 family cysteine peptidase [Myxococcota bacterium]